MHLFTPYLNRTMLTVLAMGFASGLPYLLVGATMAAWLQESGVDKTTIGLFAWVAIPYSLNFLWAPLVDHLRLPIFTRWLGRRRSWLLFAQMGIIGAILLLSTFSPAASPTLFALCALLLAFCSATQDIVIDAYRAEILEEKDYGTGAAAAVFGYRIGMLLTGAGALALAEMIDWNSVYLTMAGAMVVVMGMTLIAKEPDALRHSVASKCESTESTKSIAEDSPRNDSIKTIIRTAIIEPFRDFMHRHPHWLFILAFILAYRIPDGFIGFMVTPFLLDIGYAKLQIASIAKLYGFGATMVGMIAGGALIRRYGISRCLLWFLLFQMCTNLTYIMLALNGQMETPSTLLLTLAISLDNASGGMITGVAVAYMMSLVNKEYTATQYALLTSLASLSSKVLAGSAGAVADHYGWAAMFTASALMGLPALWLLTRVTKKNPANQTNAH